MSTYYFVIVGHNDNPIYEKEFSTVNKELRVSRAREREGDRGFSTALRFYSTAEGGSSTSQPVYSPCCSRFGG